MGESVQRFLVVDDHLAMAQSLASALGSQPDLECLGCAGTAEIGLQLARRARPDVVIVDQVMPGMDGVTFTAHATAELPGLRVIMLTAETDTKLVARAAAAGACGFVPKTGSLDELLTAIRESRPGTMTVAPSVLARMLEEPTRAAAPAGPALTPREQEVLDLIALGLDATRVARRLGISVHTCRGHLKSLLVKLDSHSQLEAVVTATRLGLLRTARGA